MKKIELALLAGLFLSLPVASLFQTQQTLGQLEENVLRLHILANSDSTADQNLKYEVRDALLNESAALFSPAPESRRDWEKLAEEKLPEMQQIAQQVVEEAGYSYRVQAALVTMPFTERVYENVTMPAGEYEAVRITIGKAEGHNWWCVMYPPLCIPVAEPESVGADTAALEEEFTEEERDMLLYPEKYRVKLKCLELLKKYLFRKIE